MSKFKYSPVFLVVLVAAGVFGSSANVSAADRTASDSGAVPDPMAASPEDLWIQSDDAQAALPALRAALSKDASFSDVVVDMVNHELVVVIEPATALAPATQDAVATAGAAIAIRVATAPVAIGALNAVRSKLIDAAEAVRTRLSGGVATGIDAAAGKVTLAGTSASTALVLGASQVDPSMVAISIVATPMSRASRLSDASPHYGGARSDMYTAPRGTNYGSCTTGFAALNGFAVRVMITAGHCLYSSSYTYYPNAMALSGTNLVGVNIGTSFPTTDVGMLFNSGQTYSRNLYTDPGAPTVRAVSSYGDTAWADTVCTDGSYTLARCSVTVIGKGQTFTDSGGTTTNLDLLYKSGAPPCQHGDSGGPVYKGTGSTGAKLTGTIVALGPDADECYAQTIASIDAALGVVPATTGA